MKQKGGRSVHNKRNTQINIGRSEYGWNVIAIKSGNKPKGPSYFITFITQ